MQEVNMTSPALSGVLEKKKEKRLTSVTKD